jgi:regulator of sirC expression with transglutaminase-like and TPR domain
MASPMKIPIRRIRDVPVILDADLAAIYGVSTKRLNEQVKRNKVRFPGDFVFRITAKEWTLIRANASQILTEQSDKMDRSQIATGLFRVRLRDQTARPYAFTEHGALMAANVLRSPEAVKMSVFIVRAFVRQREALAGNDVILRRLAEIDKTLLLHDRGLRDLYQKLLPLLQAPPDPPKRELGFHVRDRTATYRVKRRRS